MTRLKLIPIDEAAELAGVTVAAFRAAQGRRRRGEPAAGPAPRKPATPDLWHPDDVIAWASSRPGSGYRTDLERRRRRAAGRKR